MEIFKVFEYCPKCKVKLERKSNEFIKCKNCDFEYYINSVTAVTAILTNNKNEILLIKRAKNPAKCPISII
jgi:hypothetical protein